MWDWKDTMLGNCESEIVPSSFFMMAWRKEFCPSADDHDCKEVDFFAFAQSSVFRKKEFLTHLKLFMGFLHDQLKQNWFSTESSNCLLFFSSVVGFDGYNEHWALTFAHITSWLRRRVMDSSVFCFCCLWFHGCEMQAHFWSHYFLVWKNGQWILLCFASIGTFCCEKLTFAHFTWFESQITKIDSGLDYM
jgi:hypothetical protein